jgi:hypothetical protein
MILDGVRGVGKTVLLREFNYIAREQGWVTSGVVECDEGEQLPRIVAKLCHRALRDLDKRWKAGETVSAVSGLCAQDARAAVRVHEHDRVAFVDGTTDLLANVGLVRVEESGPFGIRRASLDVQLDGFVHHPPGGRITLVVGGAHALCHPSIISS